MVRTRKFNIRLYKHPDETILEYCFLWCLNIKLQIKKQYLNLIDAPLFELSHNTDRTKYERTKKCQ